MATKRYDAACSTGEYTDKNGQTKKRWQNVGVVFENDQGQLSLKLETIPVGPNWSGWISFFEPKEKEYAPVTEHSKANANAYVDDSEAF